MLPGAPIRYPTTNFEVFKAMIMKTAIFWDVALCESIVNRLTPFLSRVFSSILKIEATRSSETSVYDKPTRGHHPRRQAVSYRSVSSTKCLSQFLWSLVSTVGILFFYLRFDISPSPAILRPPTDVSLTNATRTFQLSCDVAIPPSKKFILFSCAIGWPHNY
jgi:hypothetical protein